MDTSRAPHLKEVLRLGFAAGLLACFAACAASAQTADQPPAQTQHQASSHTVDAPSRDAAAAIAALIEKNPEGGADALAKELAPLLIENPALAAVLVEMANDRPEIAEILAEVLANVQIALKEIDPEKAEQIATIVASASPAFQAAYAIAQSPDDDGGGQVADAGDGGSAGGGDGGGGAGPSGVGYGGGVGGGSAGGGTVSQAAP